MKIGGKYNWIGQSERLIFLGRYYSVNRYWNQFAKVESPSEVWCEVLDIDLHMIEETIEPHENAIQNGLDRTTSGAIGQP